MIVSAAGRVSIPRLSPPMAAAVCHETSTLTKATGSARLGPVADVHHVCSPQVCGFESPATCGLAG